MVKSFDTSFASTPKKVNEINKKYMCRFFALDLLEIRLAPFSNDLYTRYINK